MKFKASAKINLCLDVLKKDKSGYHVIQTVFHEIKSLYDEIEIINSKKDEIIINAPIPLEENLGYRALQLLKEELKIKKFAKIKITKNIPISSGLGGGASDAAAILKGLNKIWNLKLSTEKLLELSSKLGMDVSFFILGGTVYGEHFGEKLTPLNFIKDIDYTLFLNGTEIPKKMEGYILNVFPKTAQAYENLKLAKCGKNASKTKKLLKAIAVNNKSEIIKNLHNDFETATKVQEGHHLSGSGPATFTVLVNA